MMNERLTELYRECRTKEALASQDEYKSSNTLLGLEVEKFAELIVRECGEVAYKAYWDNPETVKGIHIKEAIREHFGVEE